MRSRTAFFSLALLTSLMSGAWLLHDSARAAWSAWRASATSGSLPQAVAFHPRELDLAYAVTTTSARPRRKHPGTTSASSSRQTLFVTLPASVNLAVPFLSQAPTGNWGLPYQEACEEAAAIMVQAYERGRTQVFAKDEGDQAIIRLTNFSSAMYHGRTDTSAQETGAFAQAYFGHLRFAVLPVHQAKDIERVLNSGYPVIVPASGKALHNPHFQNGGPLYHMLVVKGYLPDGSWIVNDPGTRYGADYVYAQQTLLQALHDWNGGDVMHGQPAMLVLMPQ